MSFLGKNGKNLFIVALFALFLLVSIGSIPVKASTNANFIEYDFNDLSGWVKFENDITNCTSSNCITYDSLAKATVENGVAIVDSGYTGYCGEGGLETNLTIPSNAKYLIIKASAFKDYWGGVSGIKINDEWVKRFEWKGGEKHTWDWEIYRVDISKYAGKTVNLKIVVEDLSKKWCNMFDHKVWIKVDYLRIIPSPCELPGTALDTKEECEAAGCDWLTGTHGCAPSGVWAITECGYKPYDYSCSIKAYPYSWKFQGAVSECYNCNCNWCCCPGFGNKKQLTQCGDGKCENMKLSLHVDEIHGEETKTITFRGKEFNITLVGVSFEDRSAVITVNNYTKVLEEGKSVNFGDVDILLEHLFIYNYPVKSADVILKIGENSYTCPQDCRKLTCDSPTSNFDSGCDLLLHYDKNNNGIIDTSEAQEASHDYINGKITKDEVDFVTECWKTGNGEINNICPGCYKPEKKCGNGICDSIRVQIFLGKTKRITSTSFGGKSYIIQLAGISPSGNAAMLKINNHLVELGKDESREVEGINILLEDLVFDKKTQIGYAYLRIGENYRICPQDCKPDLTITGIFLYPENQSPEITPAINDRVCISVSVENRGDAPFQADYSGLYLEAYVNGKYVGGGDFFHVFLEPGMANKFEITCINASSAFKVGDNLVKVTVDANNQYEESNENNNVKEQNFYIASPRNRTEFCKDTDGGKNYWKKGEVVATTKWGERDLEDSCETEFTGGKLTGKERITYKGPVLLEFFCEGNHVSFVEYKCPCGCENGACIKCENVTKNQTQKPNLAILSKTSEKLKKVVEKIENLKEKARIIGEYYKNVNQAKSICWREVAMALEGVEIKINTIISEIEDMINGETNINIAKIKNEIRESKTDIIRAINKIIICATR